jgi:hypothetical protein
MEYREIEPKKLKVNNSVLPVTPYSEPDSAELTLKQE